MHRSGARRIRFDQATWAITRGACVARARRARVGALKARAPRWRRKLRPGSSARSEPAFGRRILDVGAGSVPWAIAIAEHAPDREIVAIEPADDDVHDARGWPRLDPQHRDTSDHVSAVARRRQRPVVRHRPVRQCARASGRCRRVGDGVRAAASRWRIRLFMPATVAAAFDFRSSHSPVPRLPVCSAAWIRRCADSPTSTRSLSCRTGRCTACSMCSSSTPTPSTSCDQRWSVPPEGRSGAPRPPCGKNLVAIGRRPAWLNGCRGGWLSSNNTS